MNSTRLLLMLFLLLLMACTPKQLPGVDVIDIPTEELNTKISLSAPEGWNNFKIGGTITLTIINKSDDNMMFDPYYGARVFVYENGTWTEISDQLISLNTENIILEPFKYNSSATGTTSILPKINSKARRLTIRIYIIGYLYKDNIKTDERTSSFIDIVLTK